MLHSTASTALTTVQPGLSSVEVLKGTSFEAVANQLTWAVQAISQNPDWSQVLNPEPISGEVRPGESQKVTLEERWSETGKRYL